MMQTYKNGLHVSACACKKKPIVHNVSVFQAGGTLGYVHQIGAG
jgi:hypothetical protein